MVVFPLDQVPEMTRGRGVRLQRYKDGGLSDVTTFKADEGLTWTDTAGRSFTLPMKELKDWRGNRADAGRIAPKGFPKNNKFRSLPSNGKAAAESRRSGRIARELSDCHPSWPALCRASTSSLARVAGKPWMPAQAAGP